MLDITKRPAGFAAGIRRTAPPGHCVQAASIGFADCVGVMTAGAAEEPARIMSAMAPTMPQNDAAPEIPSGRLLSAPDAP